MSPARPERRLHGDHCARSFINFDTCDTGHSCRGVRIRTVPDLDSLHGIPNPDLKVSGELSAMCSTDAGRGLAFDTTPTVGARRGRPITRVDGDGRRKFLLRLGLALPGDASASAAWPGEVPRIPQSMSMPKVFSLRYSDERAIPRVAAACTRLPPASRNARRIASRSIDSSVLSVLAEIWQQ